LHKSLIICPTCRFNWPYNLLFRYFGTMITWYLQSHRTCDKLSHSCIGFFSLAPAGAFPEKKPILFFPGSVEPLRVHRQRRWV
jgi:hypothetical protein